MFVGNQNPELGTYPIIVKAYLREGTKFVSSSFSFDLVVVDSLDEQVAEGVE